MMTVADIIVPVIGLGVLVAVCAMAVAFIGYKFDE